MSSQGACVPIFPVLNLTLNLKLPFLSTDFFSDQAGGVFCRNNGGFSWASSHDFSHVAWREKFGPSNVKKQFLFGVIFVKPNGSWLLRFNWLKPKSACSTNVLLFPSLWERLFSSEKNWTHVCCERKWRMLQCGNIYFSEPDRDIRVTRLAKYLQDIDMEALTNLWSKATNKELVCIFPDGIFLFQPEKYMFLVSPKLILARCQICRKPHGNITRSCLSFKMVLEVQPWLLAMMQEKQKKEN